MQSKTIFIKLIIFSLLFFIVTKVEAQPKEKSNKSLSKKEMRLYIDKLKTKLDSINLVIQGGGIELIDSISINDTINPGGLEFIDSGEQLEESINYYSTNSTDSLLSTWYQQKRLKLNNLDRTANFDSIYFESDVSDSVYIERLKKMNSYIQLPYNNIVRNHIIYYTQKMPKAIETILGLSPHYMPLFEEIMDQHDMPKELKAMAIIESGLNPVAVSSARARGMWQFMYSTAKQYDLEITSYVDERYDPIVSGHAAAKYMKDAYRIFGDWALAIASYNCGAGNVNKAIRRSGSREFWDLYPYLPRETRGYVPAFVAALYTLNYYKEHRIEPEPCVMPAHIDTFQINKMLHFEQISNIIGIPKDIVKSLNPQYLHEIIPGIERTYILRLPYEYTNAFVESEDSIYNYKDSTYFSPINLQKIKKGVSTSNRRIIHRVRYGETLGSIAIRYRVRISDIQGWNNLRGTMIQKSQRLVIYSGGRYIASTNTGKKIIHTVRSGETIGGIAELYGIRASSIRKWNNITGDMIRLNQRLTIYPRKNYPTSSSSTPPTKVEKGYTVYTVKSGDSLWEIARNLKGVTVDDIMKLNNLNKNSKIYPGKKLRVKKLL